MRSAASCAALMIAIAALATPALAFDVQNGGGAPASGGSANLAPDASSGVSLDMDLKAQLGLSDTPSKTSLGSGMKFGSGGIFSGAANTSSMGYDERPWVAPRRPAGRD